MSTSKGPEAPKNLAEKLDTASMDIAAEKRDALRALMPEIFAEDKIDFDTLRRVLGDDIEVGVERFGLSWPGKADSIKLVQEASHATLKPCPDESVDFDGTQNLFIEGDNLEVLKLLQKSYFGQVKMIYIDPPYNRGKDFIYPDKFGETLEEYLKYTDQVDGKGKKTSTNTEADGRFHSKWLSMMYPRLYLAKNLLRDDGVIFISIDDGEVANLRKLCDQVFGEENFLADVIWRKKSSPDSRATIGSVHDHILCYLKSTQNPKACIGKMPLSKKRIVSFSNPDNDSRGSWASVDMTGMIGRATKDQYFEVELPSGRKIIPPQGRSWGLIEETYFNLKGDNRIWFGKDGNSVPRIKQFLEETKGQTVPNFWDYDDVGSNEEASEETSALFNYPKIFDTPKPERLLGRMLEIATVPSERHLTLDFFAGSATSAHAVMAQNAADGGNRRYIMVQLPEPCGDETEAAKAGYKTIAEISKERIRRAATKIKADSPDYDGDLGFRVFKLAASNFKTWDGDRAKLEGSNGNASDMTDAIAKQLEMHVDHIQDEASDDDILYEIILKCGFALTTPLSAKKMAGKTVWQVGDNDMLICLDRKLTTEVIDAMAAATPKQAICLDAGFNGNDELKTNAVQSFAIAARAAKREIKFRTV